MVISSPNICIKALEHAGNAFTYECIFEYRITYYPIPFGGWRRELTTSMDEHQTQRAKKMYIAALPKSVSVSSQRTTIGDGRTKYQRQQGWATVTEREILTVSVPKQVSWDLYFEHYAKLGHPFRDYLLSNRYEKLSQIKEQLPSAVQKHFYIFVTGIANDNTWECRSFDLSFSAMGMKPLTDISQCYGLALALIEAIGNNRDGFLISGGKGYIEVRPKSCKQAALEQW